VNCAFNGVVLYSLSFACPVVRGREGIGFLLNHLMNEIVCRFLAVLPSFGNTAIGSSGFAKARNLSEGLRKEDAS
jgi:hypothetical protein